MAGKERIETLLKQLLPVCESWLQQKEGETYFVDPLDGKEIYAHYGATHMAAALILYGKMSRQEGLYNKGIVLLKSILARWEQSKQFPVYHFDFNNFALCVAEEMVKSDNQQLASDIRRTVLHAADSNHDTINWLPMRWYVNRQRFEWTKDRQYSERCKACKEKIVRATNADGGIEDRIPKGLSFNLQYDVATVGVLQFLRARGIEYDLSKELRFLLNAVAPDGDINYQGRGTNQIFAWSLWVYLLASSGRETDLMVALDFLDGKVQTVLEKHNLMLNDYEGCEKHLWWDYHYCSVYAAHFVLWLALSLLDYHRSEIKDCHEKLPEETGLHIYRNEDLFLAVFDGRKEYLAEKGPMVCALWTKKCGAIFKGSFGPWQGLFGNQHCPQETVLNNFWGGIILRESKDYQKNKIVRKLLPSLRVHDRVSVEPTFIAPVVHIDKPQYVELEYRVPKRTVLNLPVFHDVSYIPQVFCNDEPIPVCENLLIRNQYSMLKVYRTIPCPSGTVIVRIERV